MGLTTNEASLGSSRLLGAIRRGLDFLVSRQAEDGRWDGEYGGPMFLLPMYVATAHVTGQEIPPDRRRGMVAYLRATQNADGSVGLHTEGPGTMFTTVLSYVSLRLLGVSADDADAVRMREWIRSNGTALGSASWGKSVLALLNLYGYEGVQPVPPELWRLPRFLPFHPGRLWCHVRQVYLPLAYLYAVKARRPETPLIRELRGELYDRPYAEIDFRKHRATLAPCDDYVRPWPILHAANRMLHAYERRPIRWLRRSSLEYVLDHLEYEDRTTSLVNIGPVNAVLNTIVHYYRDPDGAAFREHYDALDVYLWESPDGLLMNGQSTTALWDTAFAVQATMATPFADEYAGPMERAHRFIRDTQILDDLPDAKRYYRHPAKGGWPFGDRTQNWPVSDCTAEGFKSAVALEPMVERPLSEDRLSDSIEWLLSLQNRDGGWASYEKRRGGGWLERLNPSHVFARIMVDYSYTECTSACVQALAVAHQRFNGRFGKRLERSIQRGAGLIRRNQRPDGSWEGSWGVCFTCGAWYGVQGLRAAGLPPDSPEIRRAVDFLLPHQNPDGGWGESYESCLRHRYVPAESSHAVNTAWVLMALVGAGRADSDPAARAMQYLVDTQQEDGDWPCEPMTGVFNQTVLIHYENYRRYFPLRALAEYRRAIS